MTGLANERVVVFGGASGAGLASAKLLASKGAEVIVRGRGAATLDAKKELEAKGSAQDVDGKDVATVRAFFDEVGAFDHLVITAGATNRGGSFVGEITDQSFREIGCG